MKLIDLLNLIQEAAIKAGTSKPFIVGGIPRDKMLGIVKNEVADLDISTGDETIHNLAKEFSITISKSYNTQSKKADDGHTSILVGNLKVDFSSNFNTPGIENILNKMGLKNPTDFQKEMYSRDFTCNALLMTMDLKQIKDPTKRGFEDIKNKILKTCLGPDLTFKPNPNRIVRIIYMASKLDFDVDPEIIKWVLANKDYIKLSPPKYLTKNINKAMDKDPEKALFLIKKMNLSDVEPIIEAVKLYKTAQLRKNFDYGEGIFQNLDKYKSVSDFRKKRRNKRKKIIKKLKDMKLK